eukprot:jgi/Orpsp1_1/1177957/evm.model.c7180000063519.1
MQKCCRYPQELKSDYGDSITNNFFVNNAGNRKCNNNQCSSNGCCGYNSYYCSTSSGCLSEFGSCTINKYVPEKASKLWIHNKLSASYYGKPLCLTFVSEGEPALLKECTNNERQKWLISETKSDRIVSFFPNVFDDSFKIIENFNPATVENASITNEDDIIR